jgi:hypothetical protein
VAIKSKGPSRRRRDDRADLIGQLLQSAADPDGRARNADDYASVVRGLREVLAGAPLISHIGRVTEPRFGVRLPVSCGLRSGESQGLRSPGQSVCARDLFLWT